VQLYRSYKTCHQTLNANINECGQEQQPTYNYWTKTTMLMTQNNQVGDDNY